VVACPELVEVTVSSAVVVCHSSSAVASVEVEAVGVDWELIGFVEVAVVVGMEVVGVEVEVLGVEVAVTGVVVAVGGVEVAVIGVEVAVTGVVVEVIGIVVIVVVVEVVIIGVEVAVGSKTVSSGISGTIVDPRCLLSHSATAVTPSCHDS